MYEYVTFLCSVATPVTVLRLAVRLMLMQFVNRLMFTFKQLQLISVILFLFVGFVFVFDLFLFFWIHAYSVIDPWILTSISKQTKNLFEILLFCFGDLFFEFLDNISENLLCSMSALATKIVLLVDTPQLLICLSVTVYNTLDTSLLIEILFVSLLEGSIRFSFLT
jgi:hypothetical protein